MVIWKRGEETHNVRTNTTKSSVPVSSEPPSLPPVWSSDWQGQCKLYLGTKQAALGCRCGSLDQRARASAPLSTTDFCSTNDLLVGNDETKFHSLIHFTPILKTVPCKRLTFNELLQEKYTPPTPVLSLTNHFNYNQ